MKDIVQPDDQKETHPLDGCGVGTYQPGKGQIDYALGDGLFHDFGGKDKSEHPAEYSRISPYTRGVTTEDGDGESVNEREFRCRW